MRFEILGPLRVTGGGDIVLRGRRRLLLIALLAHPNAAVHTVDLFDWLWPGRPPRAAMATLRAHISMLRGLLEPDRAPWQPAGRLLTQPPGYLLRVDPGELDLFDFERLLRAARGRLDARDAEGAQHLLTEALALWRGGPLSDAAHVGAAHAEIARREELRLAAVTLRVEANLVLRRHQEIVPELTHLVVKYPLHERFYVQLMVALSRSGRRADALAVYRRARAVLASELAVAPGLALRHAKAAILAGEME
jgi:DNA-binding SARP family transcriptional activator